MYKLILNDQTEIGCEWCGEYEEVLSAQVSIFLIEAVKLFSDPEKTQRIVFDYGVDQNVFEGYTRLSGVRVNGSNSVLQLKKGDVANAAADNTDD